MNYVSKSFLALLTLITMAASLLAQGTASPSASVTPKVAATTMPGPTPIALPDIVAEASAAQNTLQDINAELGSDAVKTAVLQRLPNFEREIEMRNAESTRIISNGPSLDTLGELTSLWEGLSDNASSWSRELTQRATGLDADLARLDIMTEIWNMTANEARAKNAPQEVLDRIAQTHWARRGMREWVKEDPSLQRSGPVFDMPIAASIALSMLFIPVIYHSTMPRLLRAIFGIAALVPAVILLRRLLDRRTFPVLYALIILFFIDEIRAITVALPLVTRCLFIVQMMGGICFTVWLLRSRPRTANGDDAPPLLPRAGRWFVQV